MESVDAEKKYQSPADAEAQKYRQFVVDRLYVLTNAKKYSNANINV
jgi:hypothetical protein